MDHDARVVTISVVGLPPFRRASLWIAGKDESGSLDDRKELRFRMDIDTDPESTWEDWLREVAEHAREML